MSGRARRRCAARTSFLHAMSYRTFADTTKAIAMNGGALKKQQPMVDLSPAQLARTIFCSRAGNKHSADQIHRHQRLAPASILPRVAREDRRGRLDPKNLSRDSSR